MHPVLFAILVLLAVIFIAIATVLTIAAHRRRVVTGKEELVGKEAKVVSPLQPEGKVFIEGEIWQAVLEEGEALPGEEVIVTQVNGLKLRVRRKPS